METLPFGLFLFPFAMYEKKVAVNFHAWTTATSTEAIIILFRNNSLRI